MADSNSRSLHWLRIMVEGVVIVGSILLAFGIQAWWDNRSELMQLRESLTAVHDDLVRSHELLVERWLPWHASIATASMAVLWSVESDADFPDVSAPWAGRDSYGEFVNRFFVPLTQTTELSGRIVFVPDSLLAAVVFTPTYDPTVASLLALTAGGRISEVENRQLREALAGIPAKLKDLAAEEAVALNQVRTELMPSLSASASLTHIQTISPAAWLLQSSISPPILPDEVFSHSTEVEVDRRLRNALSSRVVLATDVLSTASSLEEYLAAVLALLDEEIDLWSRPGSNR